MPSHLLSKGTEHGGITKIWEEWRSTRPADVSHIRTRNNVSRKSDSAYRSINLTTGSYVGGRLTPRLESARTKLGNVLVVPFVKPHKHERVDVAGLLTPTIMPPPAKRDLQGELVKLGSLPSVASLARYLKSPFSKRRNASWKYSFCGPQGAENLGN